MYSHRGIYFTAEDEGFGHELLSFLLQAFTKNKVLSTPTQQNEKFFKLFSVCVFRIHHPSNITTKIDTYVNGIDFSRCGG
jgi:hypothetical protein